MTANDWTDHGRNDPPDPARRSSGEQRLRRGAVEGGHDVTEPAENAEPAGD